MCLITISSGSVFKILNELKVAGTVDGCAQELDTGATIRVEFDCNGIITTDFPVVDLAGNWVASVPSGDCACNEPGDPEQFVGVTVSCLAPIDGEPCTPVTKRLPLICINECIQTTSAPGGDDVFQVQTSFSCKGDGGPNAIITFDFWVKNDLPFDAFVMIDNPVIVAVIPAVPRLVPAGALQNIILQVEVPTPLSILNDTFFFSYLDSDNKVIPCRGFEVTVPISNSCCPPLEAPEMTISVNNCTLRVSWDASQVPNGCYLQFDFQDPNNPSAQFSSAGDDDITHTYSQNGLHENLTVYVKCDEGCSGNPRIFGPVNITSCDGNTPPDPDAEPESGACGAGRITAIVSGGMFLFLEALAICLGNIAVAKYALILAGISAILWFLYFLFGCNKPCGVVRLSAAETLITTGIAMMVYSACCPFTFFTAGLVTFTAGMLLFRQWKKKCNISDCAAVAELAMLATIISSYLLLILDFIPFVAACKATILMINGVKITGSKLVAALLFVPVYILANCKKPDAPEDQVVTTE